MDQPAGRAARAYLEHLIDGRLVRCQLKSRDRYGRFLSTCTNHAGLDLGQSMVGAGWAWAYTAFTRHYYNDELGAQRARLGVHGQSCELPWTWRSQQPR